MAGISKSSGASVSARLNAPSLALKTSASANPAYFKRQVSCPLRPSSCQCSTRARSKALPGALAEHEEGQKTSVLGLLNSNTNDMLSLLGEPGEGMPHA
jgi:hypothetical protein